MMKPSRKNVILLIACLTVIAVVFIFTKYEPTELVFVSNDATSKNEVKSAEDTFITRFAEIDSDADGLKDWEESLWKSDPKNKDSDGDGTADGEEVSQGRDPKIAGPHDTFDSKSAVGSENGLTSTETLARESFLQYLEAKESGKGLTAEEAENIIQNVVKVNKDRVNPVVYSQKDLVLGQKDGPSAIREFGNALGAIHKKNSPAKPENEIFLVIKAIQAQQQGLQKDEEIPKKLNSIAMAYDAIAKESLKLPIPSSAATTHLKLINAMSRLSAIIDTFSYLYDDPVMAVVGISDYQIAVNQLRDALLTLNTYFDKNGVIFADGEMGKLLVNVMAKKSTGQQ